MKDPAAGLDLSSFEAVTFDCYGTLVDWERGILAAVDRLAAPRPRPEDEEVLQTFARLETAAESGPFARYREVLRSVARGLGAAFGLEVTPQDAEAFAASVARWPPFPDSVEALERMAGRYRLGVVSNVDDDLFAGSAALLGDPFELVVTAEQVRSYKPAPEHFHEVLRRLALPRERVLHVAQSTFHDIAPARELGIPCVWVNRRAGRSGSGATAPSDARPDKEVPDLTSLVAAMGL